MPPKESRLALPVNHPVDLSSLEPFQGSG